MAVHDDRRVRLMRREHPFDRTANLGGVVGSQPGFPV